MKNLLLAAAAATALGMGACAAHATVYDWSYALTGAATGAGGFYSGSGSGTFTTASAPGVFPATITAASGTIYSDPNLIGTFPLTVTGLSSTYATPDNTIYATGTNGPIVSYGGVSLALSDGETINLFYDAGLPANQITNSVANPSGNAPYGRPIYFVIDMTIAAVPEPSTWAMMMLGFAGLAFAGVRARRAAPSRG